MVVANIRVRRKGRLKNYRHARQKFPLTLPLGPKDANTTTFDALAANKCVKPKKKRSPGMEWISERTWKLIVKCASLLISGVVARLPSPRRTLFVSRGPSGWTTLTSKFSSLKSA